MTFETNPEDEDRSGPATESSSDAEKLPAAPADDDSAMGDTDEHSSADT